MQHKCHIFQIKRHYRGQFEKQEERVSSAHVAICDCGSALVKTTDWRRYRGLTWTLMYDNSTS